MNSSLVNTLSKNKCQVHFSYKKDKKCLIVVVVVDLSLSLSIRRKILVFISKLFFLTKEIGVQ